MSSFDLLILAAGQGKRMKSAKSKVLHKAMGLSLVEHVLRACQLKNRLSKVICVASAQNKDSIKSLIPLGSLFCIQKEQKGTGHAVSAAIKLLSQSKSSHVLVVPGDMPLLEKKTIQKLVNLHLKKDNDATMLTGKLESPKGYGRIIRNKDNLVESITEDKDLLIEQRKVNEVNTGVYLFKKNFLRKVLPLISCDNAQSEYYLTDFVSINQKKLKKRVGALTLGDSRECMGVNSRKHLSQVTRILKNRKIEELFDQGVTIVDPESTFIDAGVKIGQDTIIHPFTVISGKVTIGKSCEIGPFAHIREDVVLADEVCIGNFVETKKSRFGKNSKAKHLSYLGDTTLGSRVNIGAGTITANYDGKNKHPTQIKSGTRIGSNTVIVAPNIIGNECVVGAGSVIPANKNFPAKSLIKGIPARGRKQA